VFSSTRRALGALLPLVAALLLCSSAVAGTTVSTLGAWDGSNYEDSWGNSATHTYGQIVTAPGTVLNSFEFEIAVDADTNACGEVYAWDGTKATGPALYESAPITLPGDDTFHPVTFTGVNAPMTPGQQYILFVSVDCDPAPGDASDGIWGLTDDDSADSSGTATYFNDDTAADWTTSDWDGNGDIGADFAYTATYDGGSGNGSGAASPLPPVVTALSPASGPAGTSVDITGDHFESVKQVLFGGVPAGFVDNGYQHLTAIAPSGLTGTVDVTVVNANGTSSKSAADQFTYTAPSSTTAQPGASGPKQLCLMPNLLRHTYRGAKKLMKLAGCDLPLSHSGHAKQPRHAKHYRHAHVKSQSPDAGTGLFAGDKPSIKLG
jgi:hypothetical protein